MEHSKSSDKSEYRVGLHSVRLQTAPTGRESVYLFFEFTIILYTLRSSGARVLDLSLFYRHIAPLERKAKYFRFNRQSINFQERLTDINLG